MSRANLTSHISIVGESGIARSAIERRRERERAPLLGKKENALGLQPPPPVSVGVRRRAKGGSVTVAKSSLAHSAATPATQSVVKTAEM